MKFYGLKLLYSQPFISPNATMEKTVVVKGFNKKQAIRKALKENFSSFFLEVLSVEKVDIYKCLKGNKQ